MKRWLLSLLFSLLATAAFAQPKTPAAVNGCVYYSSLLSPTTGQTVTFTCGANGELLTGLIVGGAEVSGSNPLPISGSFSANLGGFAPGGSYATPLSVTNSTGNVALPTGTVVVVYNVGANAAYVKLGTSNAVTATTADDYIPSGGAIALTVGSNTYLAAITASLTTTLNLSGGAGLFTGLSGVGGGGSGGTVTQGTAGSAGSAWYVQPGTGATWAATESGTWNVGLSAGSNAIGSITNTTFAATQSGTWTVQPGNTPNTTPWVITPWIGGAVNSATNGLYFNILQGNAVNASGNPIFAQLTAGAAVIGAVTQSGTWTVTQGAAASSGPWIATPWIGGAVNSATNGLYVNLLQGNAVNASGNPIFAQITTLPALVAGSAIIGKVGIDQTTPGTTNGVQVNAALPTGTNSIGAVSQTNGDPCSSVTHVFTPISVASAANTKIVAGTSAKKTYICHLFLFAAGADNVAVVEGTGTNCGASTTGVIGGATAAAGLNLIANQGFVEGSGTNAVAAAATAADDLCLITSTTAQLSGVIVSVQQ